MKTSLWLIVGIIVCLLAAAWGYNTATSLMDSIFAYRSPLTDSAPKEGQPLGKPLTRQVVIVLVDALRDDTSHKTDVMPFLNELRQGGAWATMHSRPPSYSEPGYSVLLTGAWPDLSDGPTINVPYEEIPTFTQDNLFSAAQRAGLNTAVSGYYWFEKLIPQSAVTNAFYTPGEDRVADREVVDAALPWLGDSGYQLVLIHLDQVDYAGHHEGGAQDPNWDAAAKRADELLKEITRKLDLSQDTLLVVSDHGQIDRGGHGGQDPITLLEPFVLVGMRVRAGEYGDLDMVDVAPTMAAFLGVNIPASSQGHVRMEMMNLTSEQAATIQKAVTVQQAVLAQAYQEATGLPVKAEPGSDIVAVTQQAIEVARMSRLNAERLPRALLAIVLAVIPAAVFFWKRGKDTAWLLGGAILYLLLFNLRYAVLDGRTYSLSSVDSADAIVVYCALTALIALGISWLVTMLSMGAFRRGALNAAVATLALVMVTIYLLFLPFLLHFVVNGTLVTWTLPEFTTSFIGFLSLIQILLVAALGLVLCGISALVGRLVRR